MIELNFIWSILHPQKTLWSGQFNYEDAKRMSFEKSKWIEI